MRSKLVIATLATENIMGGATVPNTRSNAGTSKSKICTIIITTGNSIHGNFFGESLSMVLLRLAMS